MAVMENVRDPAERCWAQDVAERHLGRAVDRAAPIVTDAKGRVMILSPGETLLLDHDSLTRLSTVEDVGRVGEVFFFGQRLARHVIDPWTPDQRAIASGISQAYDLPQGVSQWQA